MTSPSSYEMERLLGGLKKSIEQMRALDGRGLLWKKKWKVFGARRHQFKLKPPLAENALADFETAFHISLPPDYRAFLGAIGDGGAGPGYGLTSLADAHIAANLLEPFPLTQSSDLYDEDDEVRLKIEDELPGVLQLCHRGCGMYSYLVVKGPTYGTVWYDNGEFHPTGLSFLQWYGEWVDESLQLLKSST